MLLFAATLWSQDLLYERTDGRTMTLDSLPDSRMTLLLFYDPECGDCQQELFVMRHSSQSARSPTTPCGDTPSARCPPPGCP